MSEIWKDIKEYEGMYQISNLGRVKGLVRKWVPKEKIMSQSLYSNGYVKCTLKKNRKANPLLVHRLVAKAFILNPNNLKTVDHKDENKTNNVIGNLRWMSQYDNWRRSNMGENNTKSKLIKKEVKEIRELYKSGDYTQKQLSNKYDISEPQINAIINYRSWKDEK